MRPSVAVVMPFAGGPDALEAALAALRALDAEPGDELILVDNSPVPHALDPPGITVIRADAEHSPAHARNVGAARADREWILFLDADCHPRPGLLRAYLEDEIAPAVGALAGEVVAAAGTRGVASRYGAARSFLSQAAHLAHPYRPRAAAANLLVRRAALAELGGFFEGLRAAEDTDFCWRLQAAGWRLELRAGAWAAHRYRTSLRALRRQWRGYAAGRAWLARRYEDFHPEPALARALRHGSRRSSEPSGPDRPGMVEKRRTYRRFSTMPAWAGRQIGSDDPGRPNPSDRLTPLLDCTLFPLIDGVLAVEELVGFLLSNRPSPPVRSSPTRHPGHEPRPSVVLLTDRFPAPDDPLAELAAALDGARVQAVARPDRIDLGRARRVPTTYVEDDGLAARVLACGQLLVRHPLRCGLDRLRASRPDQGLAALAPAALGLERDHAARVLALGAILPRSAPARIARLAGRRLDDVAPG